MRMPYRCISRESIAGKTLVVRVDFNSSVSHGKLVPSARLRQHAESLRELASRGAKLVVLSHQGRRHDPDFVSLRQHAALVERQTGLSVRLCPWSEGFVEKIRALDAGEVLLMENTRFNEDEAVERPAAEHAKSPWVKAIASNADAFVQDALSVCHRMHASVVGFAPLLPCYVGVCLERELEALRAVNEFKRGRILVLGGAKPIDSLLFLERMLVTKRADLALVGGLFAEIFFKALGKSFGAKDSFFARKGLLSELSEFKRVLQVFKQRILLPEDLAVEENCSRKNVGLDELPCKQLTKDIGSKTIELFSGNVLKAKLVVFNGPLGVFEEALFCEGTKRVLEAIAQSRAFSLLGGGDTETALEKLGFSVESFSHVSLAGKALLAYLSGERLPGLAVLER